ncbi:uncharacterized protein LOC124495315 [Dermatophagoides farinae]|uniref:Cysteine-rich hydrophobic domain 2 protein-like protein n=2 Tax=Dermatophagoides farinae TaxID=6954 RepID=A0A9D4NR98_DERFA|nr:uncharacterized protein LOC124495315 [Dermatophagoides farinae]KAH7636723.1 cysteine-rich hydrophobic domain 2 protein-like protein [Dermatophagoides farinae]
MADFKEGKIIDNSTKSFTKSTETMDRINFEQTSTDCRTNTQQKEEVNNNENENNEWKSKSELRTTRLSSSMLEKEKALDIHVSENHFLINHQQPSTSRIDHHIVDISSSSSSSPNAAPVNAMVAISLSSTPLKSHSTSLSKIVSICLDNHKDNNIDSQQVDSVVVCNSDNHAQQLQQPHYPCHQQQMIRTISNGQQPNNILEIERINLDDDDDDDGIDKINKRHGSSYRHQHKHQMNSSDTDDTDDDDAGVRDNIRRLNPVTSGDAGGITSLITTSGSRRQSQQSLSSNQNIDYLLSLLPPNELNMEMPFEDPIQIRGNGNITLFGLSNCYQSSFPSALLGRVSKEEFEYTIGRINHLLQQQHSTNIKFLLLGCLCCCFSLGCSLLWPGFALSRRTKNSLEKLLAMENSRLYNKLGLNWRLSKQPSHTNHSFMEYILIIDFLPKMHIYQPD